MSDGANNDLRQRLASLNDQEAGTGGTGRAAKPGAAKLALALGGAAVLAGAVYVYSQPEGETVLPVRQAQEFQPEGSGFGDMDRPQREEPAPEPAAVVEAVPDPVPAPDNSEVIELIRSLQAQVDALSKPAPEAESPASDGENEALATLQGELEELRQQAENRERELQNMLSDRDLQIAGLNNEMDMLRLQGGGGFVPGSDDDLLAQRRQAAEEAAQLEQQRLQSSMIAIGGGDGPGGAIAEAAGFGDAGAAQQAAKLSDDAAFVRNAGRPVQVQRAEIIVNPANTVTQGTMIQAVLETAIDSTLEGPIRGVVTTDVVSYDGSRILIPRGSKLIGSYSADVDTGQNRLLVAWERIIMPDNQSVQISSFGGDALGRSGTTGKVNSHFFKRFGAAALISTISAIPSLLEDEDSDGGVTISTGGSDAATGVSDALGGATDAAIGKYISIPPTITVAQGTRVTVMVDRDLEIF
ncbi:TrbI/VirB10 family protein [Paracoccus yeei]|uniref:TrbI/VirB10 family protein n=1 Tax=Paracoccus yeei TaxID=147645 RepID=UPI001C8E6820|nr:TrbI/VirB10 family protein [Paracoccus yeei]MBY0138351.1 conjugal transfer protein [Paracoccus yeei]